MAAWGPQAFRSVLTLAVLAVIYPFVCIPAVIDAWQAARGGGTPLLSRHQRWYVILMLLTIGPMALPLLWQSPRFSRTAKLLWTAAVILIALLGILSVTLIGPAMERGLRDFQETLQRTP